MAASAAARKDYFQDRRADLWAYPWRCPAVRQFTPIADIPSRQRLRSSSSDDLLVSAVRLSKDVVHAFLVAGARTWNDLSTDVTSAPYLSHLQKTTKTASVSTLISWPSFIS